MVIFTENFINNEWRRTSDFEFTDCLDVTTVVNNYKHQSEKAHYFSGGMNSVLKN